MAALKKKRIKPRLAKRDDPIYREPWHCGPVRSALAISRGSDFALQASSPKTPAKNKATKKETD